ncbi:hypothetical protein FOMPIDRAFT_1015943 [Fomitopsis schrenkii]|uniref:Uncharacterized protein n=1 Tax=Fomitopsis schrenkii TaxID=2126942 RepID=S8FTE3_FOMSC|nr:hypothetical protein FOMPIDRAFT_1015943 [Fomitopsis schrenkii]
MSSPANTLARLGRQQGWHWPGPRRCRRTGSVARPSSVSESDVEISRVPSVVSVPALCATRISTVEVQADEQHTASACMDLITTPNESPPPPQSAENRSRCWHSSATRYRPLGAITLTWTYNASERAYVRKTRAAYQICGQFVNGEQDAKALPSRRVRPKATYTSDGTRINIKRRTDKQTLYSRRNL